MDSKLGGRSDSAEKYTGNFGGLRQVNKKEMGRKKLRNVVVGWSSE